MPTWREVVEEAVSALAAAGIGDAEQSARWIGHQATGTSSADWHEVIDQPATERQLASFDRMMERRSGGEPLQYVLGAWGFRTLDLMVDHRVLIPRPETETVAGFAIDELDRVRSGGAVGAEAETQTETQAKAEAQTQSEAEADRPPPVVADLGTGSGAIGLAIAAERPRTQVWLTDVSADALQVARANLAGLGRAGGAVQLASGDWFDALPASLAGTLGVIVSNPPYVATVDDLDDDVARWEPELALLADRAGLAHLEHLVDHAPAWLRPDGALILELDPRQVVSIVDRARRRFAQVEAKEDLAGRLRAVVARHPRRA